MNETEILQRDLSIMEAMTGHMDDYLMSDATHWDMGIAGMPLMSLGGFIMRQNRLMALREHLGERDQGRLGHVIERFDCLALEHVVRFEARANAELQARMREWTHYLHDLNSRRIAASQEHYRNTVDTRVVIGVLAEKLAQRPFQLAAHIPNDIVGLDRHLAMLWVPGSFIWHTLWRPAYPGEAYWYLFGYPYAGE